MRVRQRILMPIGKKDKYRGSMDNDLIDMTRSLIDKDGSASDRWLAEVSENVKDPNVVKQFFMVGTSKGKAPSDFDDDVLAKGVAVEREHTTMDVFAKKIAMDHISENIKYYDKLEVMEDSTTI